MSNSQLLIEKGLEMLNPELGRNMDLKKRFLAFIKKELKSECRVAVLYTKSSKFLEFLEGLHIDPNAFIGKRELIITEEHVKFSADYYHPPRCID